METQVTARPPIRVLIADDSSVVREVLKQMLETDPEIRVVGMATTGREAVDMTSALRPDLITMDLKMPDMDGYEATEQIMAYHPTPILIVTSYLNREGMYPAFDLLAAGALDIIEKPSIVPHAQWQTLVGTLVEKVKLLAREPVIAHVQGRTAAQKVRVRRPAFARPEVEVVGIGVSTGGPRVLQRMLSALPADFSLAVLVVQHITEGFLPSLLRWLQPLCRLPLRIAQNGDAVAPGRIFFAPDQFHLVVGSDKTLRLSEADPIGGHRPSVDLAFRSLAMVYGSRAAGVLLTGTGSDGAESLRLIREAGGVTLVQNEESCAVFGMPRAAIDLGAAQYVLPVVDLVEKLLSLHRRRARVVSR